MELTWFIIGCLLLAGAVCWILEKCSILIDKEVTAAKEDEQKKKEEVNK